MDALVLERVATEWAHALTGLAFRGLEPGVSGVRTYFGPKPGGRGAVWALAARWVEPIWAWVEESPLPKERQRAEVGLRFEGSTIERVVVPTMDRRVRFEFADESFFELEVWPPGNAVLVDRQGMVRWVARRRSASTVRGELAAGSPYADPPSPFRFDPRRASAEATGGAPEGGGTTEVAIRLRHHFAGLPGPLAEVAARVCDAASPGDAEARARALSEWARTLYAADTPVTGLLWKDKHRVAHLVSARADCPLGSEVTVFGPWRSWDDAARAVAREFPEAITNEELAEARSRARRLESALRAARSDLAMARRGPEYRKKAQALLASLAEVPRRVARVRLPDPEAPERTLDIELDPKLPPHKNAARYFQMAAKSDRGLETIPVRLQVLEDEERKTVALLESLERGVRPPGYQPPATRGDVSPSRPARGSFGPATRGRDEVPARLLPRRYRTAEGWEVWIGKTNEGNDFMTHRLAHGEDYWFHVRGAPGSHVVLRRGKAKDEPSKATLAEVAGWAAFHSRQRTSGLVLVAYTRKKYVRKPRGSKPGLASITQEKVIFARPKEPPKEAVFEEETPVGEEA